MEDKILISQCKSLYLWSRFVYILNVFCKIFVDPLRAKQIPKPENCEEDNSLYNDQDDNHIALRNSCLYIDFLEF